jgi:hypothetical protein
MKKIALTCAVLLHGLSCFAQQNVTFQTPPKEILDLADAQRPPFKLVTEDNKYILFLQRPVYKTLEELMGEELKLAGLRINPNLFDNSRASYFTKLDITELVTGKKIEMPALPTGYRIAYPMGFEYWNRCCKENK